VWSDEHSKGGAGVSPDRDEDAKKDPIVVEISVQNGPISGIVASPDGSRLMVTNYGGDSVSIIDTDSCRLVETVPCVQEPFAIAAGGPDAIAPDRVYVSSVSGAYDSVEVIDVSTNTVVATHPLALRVSDLAVSADGRFVYASRNGNDSADVAALHTTTGRVEVVDIGGPGTTTQCVRTSPNAGLVYVGTNGPAGGRLVVLAHPGDTPLRVIAVVEIGMAVRDVAISPDGAVAYVASCCPELGAVLDVIDVRTHQVTSTRKLGEISGNLTGCTLSRDGDRAYLVGDDGITVLCTLTQDILGTVAVTGQPSCVVESPDGTRLYLADYSGAVIVTPVPFAIEGATHRGDVSAEWVMPELLQYAPALAL
jgi:YVTN family beta-propeller protein